MPEWNVKDYGAAGDGSTDDAAAIQRAVNEAGAGGTVRFPAGVYRICSRIRVSRDHTELAGEGRHSRLVYEYGQTEDDDDFSASLFAFREGIRDVTVRDLKIEYTGPFFGNVGESYAGKVSALRFGQCFDVRVDRVDISGFNFGAVKIMTGDPGKYAERVKVTRSHLHHNRVGGVLFGYVDGISITDCDLNHNGSAPDGGTGYGCAGLAQELPVNIQIIGNRANGNYRKGIDLHAGIGAVIADNICHANRLYGIYAEGSKTGNVVIRGNIVSGMHRRKLDIGEPYTWIMGIDFGPYAESLVPEPYHNYVIEGNQILDFGLDEGDAYPINCYFNMASGNVMIRGNIVTARSITHLIRMKSRVAVDEGRRVQLDISHNQASIESCSGELFHLPRIDQLNMTGNQLTVRDSRWGDGARWGDRAEALAAEGRAWLQGNFLNGRLAVHGRG